MNLSLYPSHFNQVVRLLSVLVNRFCLVGFCCFMLKEVPEEEKDLRLMHFVLNFEVLHNSKAIIFRRRFVHSDVMHDE